MTEPLSLFTVDPEFCIDTNVIVSFLSETDNEFYGADIFGEHWRKIETAIASGRIVAPRQVEHELEGHAKKRAKVGPWLKSRGFMFREVDTDAQLHFAKRVVNKYPVYRQSRELPWRPGCHQPGGCNGHHRHLARSRRGAGQDQKAPEDP